MLRDCRLVCDVWLKQRLLLESNLTFHFNMYTLMKVHCFHSSVHFNVCLYMGTYNTMFSDSLLPSTYELSSCMDCMEFIGPHAYFLNEPLYSTREEIIYRL